MHNTTTHQGGPGVLASLRALHPRRPLSLPEALHIAELQAARLLDLQAAHAVPIPTTIITQLPHITVEHDPDLPAHAASGCSDWDSQRRSWVISLNAAEPRRRRRFTVLHEYKHILDHGSPPIRDRRSFGTAQRPAEEVVADYFAGCVLVPKRLLAAAYYDGIQGFADLAQLFDVSKEAIGVRLHQVGLIDWGNRAGSSPRYRMARPASNYDKEVLSI